jgi:NADH-quinone oxidoreductase subunit N
MEIIFPVVDISAVSPQIALVTSAILVLVLGLFDGMRRVIPYIAVGLLAICGIVATSAWGGEARAFSDLSAMAVLDDFTIFSTLIFIAGGILTILISVSYAEHRRIDRGEYYALILFAISGMSLMAASVNLFTFFLSLEVLSISLYVLIGIEYQKSESNESALKYFLLGAFASGFILYGIALIYGGTGSTDFAAISDQTSGGSNLLVLAGLGLLLVGIGFKISMAPFHSWTPDVYQGAPTPISAFMSTGSKAAGFAVLVRVFVSVFPQMRPDWVPLLSGLAVLTIAVGNLVALVQTDLKRLLAYSSIAHAGYMLLAIVAGGPEGSASILFYLLIYTLMNMAAFGVIAVLSAKGDTCHGLTDIAGLAKRHPIPAMVMAVAMFSLAGIPPTAGFVAKFYIFTALIQTDHITLAIIGVLFSGVSLFYYLRVIVWMYMKDAPISVVTPSVRLSIGGVAAICVSALAIIQLGIAPSYLIEMAQQAVSLLQ